MSATPRPCTFPSSIAPLHGSRDQVSAGPAGKTSIWPLSTKWRPLRPPSKLPTTLGRCSLAERISTGTPLARNCASRKSAAGRVSPGGFGLGMATKADRNLMSSFRSSSIQARMRSLGVIISLHSAVSGSGVVGLEDSLVGLVLFFSVEITCAHHGTNHVDDQATGGDAGDLVDVGAGRDLHDIHADDAALLHQTMDQLARLGEGDAAGAGARHARRDRRIHPVEVDGEVIATAIGDAREHGLHAVVVNLVGADQMRAIGLGGLDFLGAGAAGGAQPNLKDLVDMLHFRGSADGARIAFGDAVNFVAPVEMLVDLDKSDGSIAVQTAQHRDRDAMVAADHDRQGAGGADLPDRGLALNVVSGQIPGIADHVA